MSTGCGIPARATRHGRQPVTATPDRPAASATCSGHDGRRDDTGGHALTAAAVRANHTGHASRGRDLLRGAGQHRALSPDRIATSLARCRTSSRSSRTAGDATYASGSRFIRSRSARSAASRWSLLDGILGGQDQVGTSTYGMPRSLHRSPSPTSRFSRVIGGPSPNAGRRNAREGDSEIVDRLLVAVTGSPHVSWVTGIPAGLIGVALVGITALLNSRS